MRNSVRYGTDRLPVADDRQADSVCLHWQLTESAYSFSSSLQLLTQRG